ADELLGFANADKLPSGFFAIQADEAKTTGIVRKDEIGLPSYQYNLIRVGDHYLIAGTPSGYPGNRLVITLTTRDDYEKKEVVPTLLAKYPDLKERILPFSVVIYNQDNLRAEAEAWLIVLAVLAAPGCLLIFLGLVWAWKPGWHPRVKPLA